MRLRLLPLLAGLAWGVWIAIAVLYVATEADEGAYLWQSYRMSLGDWPVLDYYTIHMPWAYIPFAALQALFAPGIDAARLFAILTLWTSIAIAVLLANRAGGGKAGWITFFILAFLWTWFSMNGVVAHVAPSNLGLLIAVALLVWREDRPLAFAFLSGLAAGLMVNARVVLLPVGALLLAIWIFDVHRQRGGRAAAKAALVFALGGLLMSLPTLTILIKDPDAFFFDYLFSRLRIHLPVGDAPSEGMLGWLFFQFRYRVLGLVDLFTFQGWGKPGWAQNMTLLLPWFALALVAMFERKTAALIRRRLVQDALLRRLFLVVLAVYGSYNLADVFRALYLYHILPLLAVAAGVLAAHLLELSQWRRSLRFVFAATLAAHALYFLVLTGIDVARRNEPGVYRPVTIARMGCWLESATAPETRIVSLASAPVANAGRRGADGIDQGVGGLSFAWRTGLTEDEQRRYKFLPEADLILRLRQGDLPIFIEDAAYESALKAGYLQDVPAVLDSQFRKIASSGGNFPYVIHAHRGFAGDLPPLNPWPALTLNAQRTAMLMADRDYKRLIGEGFDDLGRSASMLPGDLAASLGRAFGAGFETRCHRLLFPEAP
ncbi:MAG: hypothetical protein HQL45_01015 [Alphaproteobacteria bacterium]|nr:hypothetical protein [Alphaproteobacteria bacterium]